MKEHASTRAGIAQRAWALLLAVAPGPGPAARCSLGCRRSDCCSGGGKRSSVRRYGHADRHRRQQERLRHGRGHVPHMGQQAVRPRRGAEDGPGRGRHRTRQGRSHDGGPAGHRRGEGRPQGLRRLGVLVRQVPQLRDLEGRREAGRLEQRRLFSRPILVPVRQRRLYESFVRPRSPGFFVGGNLYQFCWASYSSATAPSDWKAYYEKNPADQAKGDDGLPISEVATLTVAQGARPTTMRGRRRTRRGSTSSMHSTRCSRRPKPTAAPGMRRRISRWRTS